MRNIPATSPPSVSLQGEVPDVCKRYPFQTRNRKFFWCKVHQFLFHTSKFIAVCGGLKVAQGQWPDSQGMSVLW